jgi:hypothetical protein
MVVPGEGPPDGLHGGQRTTTTARWLGVLAGVLTVTFGLLLALTHHLAASPGASPTVFGPTVSSAAPSPLATQSPTPQGSVTSIAGTTAVPAAPDLPSATATVTMTVTVNARTGAPSAATAGPLVPYTSATPAVAQANNSAHPAPTVTSFIAVAPDSGGGSGWTAIAAAGTGM